MKRARYILPCGKSPASEKGPTFYEKSPISSEMSSAGVFAEKCINAERDWRLCIVKRAVYLVKRAIHLLKRAVYLWKTARCLLEKALQVCLRGNTSTNHCEKSPVSSEKKSAHVFADKRVNTGCINTGATSAYIS